MVSTLAGSGSNPWLSHQAVKSAASVGYARLVAEDLEALAKSLAAVVASWSATACSDLMAISWSIAPPFDLREADLSELRKAALATAPFFRAVGLTATVRAFLCGFRLLSRRLDRLDEMTGKPRTNRRLCHLTPDRFSL